MVTLTVDNQNQVSDTLGPPGKQYEGARGKVRLNIRRA